MFFGRIIGDTGEDGPPAGVLRVGPHVEGDDAQVVGALTDAMINERQTLVLDFAQAGRRAIAEQMNFGAGFVAGERLGHLERLGQARRRVGHPARLEGAAQQ